MDLVKITKVKLDDKFAPVYDIKHDDEGKVVSKKPVMEDIVCEVLHWGKEPIQEGGVWVYYTAVFLRRTDDGTVEWAFPDQIMYLDQIKRDSGVVDDGESMYPNQTHG